MSLETILEKVPSLRTIPQNMLLAGVVVIGLFSLYLLFFFIGDFFKKEVEEHRAPTPQEMIRDLQRSMVKEMKGTSKQNWIMIILTIIFISVSMFGGEYILDLVRKIFIKSSAEAPAVIEKVKSVIGK